ncbi:MAG: low molecular weight protein arginine phosphatase [bacterium]|jgi:protein-tyrosine-phosphatase
MGQIKKILIVCTGNTCRSPMAAYLLNHLAANDANGKDIITAESAGIFAQEGMPAAREAIEVLAKVGIDLTGHKARQLTSQMLREADLVLTMTNRQKDIILKEVPEAREKVFTLAEFSLEDTFADIIDPFGQSAEIYEQIYRELQEHLSRVLTRIQKWVD